MKREAGVGLRSVIIRVQTKSIILPLSKGVWFKGKGSNKQADYKENRENAEYDGIHLL